MKGRISDYRYKGELQKLDSYIDEYDRPVEGWVRVRDIFFSELGISANELFISAQEKSSVDRRIALRYEPLLMIDRSLYHIKIGELSYQIERVYTDLPNERMELSLSYVR
ncbi:phage head closure protein [Enterococcus dispar]|uniref:phage head closure protein n=1 Tax=Enterococcus dispar TaxID=44009 RepID=UPI002330CF69|nr:phage head closure protein [Enterococcus dispar]WCG32807.1 phage head closure protein [Enterococcus dispar]